jgi:hypothetical protein
LGPCPKGRARIPEAEEEAEEAAPAAETPKDKEEEPRGIPMGTRAKAKEEATKMKVAGIVGIPTISRKTAGNLTKAKVPRARGTKEKEKERQVSLPKEKVKARARAPTRLMKNGSQRRLVH